MHYEIAKKIYLDNCRQAEKWGHSKSGERVTLEYVCVEPEFLQIAHDFGDVRIKSIVETIRDIQFQPMSYRRVTQKQREAITNFFLAHSSFETLYHGAYKIKFDDVEIDDA